MSSFSAGLSWVNFDLGLTLPGRNTTEQTNATEEGRLRRYRRNQNSKSKGKSGQLDGFAQDKGSGTCSPGDLLPPTEIFVTCLCVMVCVSLGRQLAACVFTHYLKKDQPASLIFGAWEGPGGFRSLLFRDAA